MGATTLTGLRYPEATATPFVHLDVKTLAEDVDALLEVVSETAPPHKEGRRWYKPSTKIGYRSAGGVWRRLSQSQTTTSAGTEYGAYAAGIPTRTTGGWVSVTTNASSLASVTLPSDFGAGLAAVVFTSTNDPPKVWRIVRGSSTSPNNIQVVIYNVGGTGAGAGTFAAYCVCVGWD